MANRTRRGSTLVVTVVIIAVLTIVAIGMIRRSTTELEAAGARRGYDVALSCADGARELLLSQFRTYGVVLTTLQLDETVGNRRYASGHFDRFGLRTVVPVDPGLVGGATDNAMDLANRSARLPIGGAAYRVTVVCSDSSESNRQSEVEFVVRFGM